MVQGCSGLRIEALADARSSAGQKRLASAGLLGEARRVSGLRPISSGCGSSSGASGGPSFRRCCSGVPAEAL